MSVRLPAWDISAKLLSISDTIKLANSYLDGFLYFQAWKLWNEGDITALVVPAISDPCFQVEIFRCIHIGLLCMQELAKDRPAVSTITSMLNSEIVDLPPPKKPAFVERQSSLDTESITQNQEINSINNVTISDVNGR